MPSYLDIGFSPNFRRIRPDDNSGDVGPILQSLGAGQNASNILGGVLQSTNGNLSIDLNQGQMTYNDGINTLLNIGGPNNNVTITDSNSNALLATTPTTTPSNTITNTQSNPQPTG